MDRYSSHLALPEDVIKLLPLSIRDDASHVVCINDPQQMKNWLVSTINGKRIAWFLEEELDNPDYNLAHLTVQRAWELELEMIERKYGA